MNSIFTYIPILVILVFISLASCEMYKVSSMNGSEGELTDLFFLNIAYVGICGVSIASLYNIIDNFSNIGMVIGILLGVSILSFLMEFIMLTKIGIKSYPYAIALLNMNSCIVILVSMFSYNYIQLFMQ